MTIKKYHIYKFMFIIPIIISHPMMAESKSSKYDLLMIIGLSIFFLLCWFSCYLHLSITNVLSVKYIGGDIQVNFAIIVGHNLTMMQKYSITKSYSRAMPLVNSVSYPGKI